MSAAKWSVPTLIGGLCLVLVMGWAVVRRLGNQAAMEDPTLKYVRVAHWQLEAGYRDAFQDLIDEYNRMHAAERVKVVQMPVTEKVYAQWLNVNLVAGNPPDIAEMGQHAREVDSPEAVARNFVPIGRDVLQPNPYNAPQWLDELDIPDPALRKQVAERLATAPWRDTLTDGMRGGWNATLQDYYGVSTSFVTIRLMVNLDLLRQATGSAEPPTTFDAFLKQADRVKAWAGSSHPGVEAIACVGYHLDILSKAYLMPFSYGLRDRLDRDWDGQVSPLECYAALQDGSLKWDDPALVGYHQLMHDLCARFNPNFSSMDRDQAMSRFVTGRAAFMVTGSWDANTAYRLVAAGPKFAVTAIPIPMPGPGERYGTVGTPMGLCLGGSEAGTWGCATFGITKHAAHPEVALDFLRFLSSHRWNQRLNRATGWLPVTIGATASPNLQPFMPNPYGTAAMFALWDGGDLENRISAKRTLVYTGELPVTDLPAQVAPLVNDPAIGVERVWARQERNNRDSQRTAERTIAVHSFRDLAGIGQPDTAERVREIVLDQTLNDNGTWITRDHRRRTGKPLAEEQ